MTKSKCAHCCGLVEGDNKEWFCDEREKPIEEVEVCPEGITSAWEIGDDVIIKSTGEKGRIQELLHGDKYTVYVGAEGANDGGAYCNEFSGSDLE